MKGFYLLLYSKALNTLSLLSIEFQGKWGIKSFVLFIADLRGWALESPCFVTSHGIQQETLATARSQQVLCAWHQQC